MVTQSEFNRAREVMRRVEREGLEDDDRKQNGAMAGDMDMSPETSWIDPCEEAGKILHDIQGHLDNQLSGFINSQERWEAEARDADDVAEKCREKAFACETAAALIRNYVVSGQQILDAPLVTPAKTPMRKAR